MILLRMLYAAWRAAIGTWRMEQRNRRRVKMRPTWKARFARLWCRVWPPARRRRNVAMARAYAAIYNEVYKPHVDRLWETR